MHRTHDRVMTQEEQESEKWTWVEESGRASGHGRDARPWRGETLTLGPCIGNAKLLETITARSQVLSSGGEPNGEIAGELYAEFPRGIFPSLVAAFIIAERKTDECSRAETRIRGYVILAYEGRRK